MEIEEVRKKRGGNRHKILDPAEIQEVTVPFPLVNKPKVRLALTVSARGSGLCMYIPKEDCDLYGIIAGHILVVKIDEHYRKRLEDT
jgi:hypothetical protein